MLDKIDIYKTELDKKRPFRDPDLLKELQKFYRIDLAFTSNALEGNSLTISETKIILEDGITVGGKPLRDILEALGHGAAYDYMFSLIQNNCLSVNDIYKMHRLFYVKIDAENAGVLRKQQVYISGSEHNSEIPQFQDLPSEMQKIETWMRNARHKTHPVLFAALLHKKLAQTHPFIDGNGRICRLSMNAVLVQNGYPPAIVPPILRGDYIRALEKSWTDERPLVKFIAARVLETEKGLMRMLHIPFPEGQGEPRQAADGKLMD
ncbi:MAG: Fic family protein [Synergistaceae bacterium]|jgi:Fic family protein|nr:Fic family protein [Synergistaceae bacterium]